MEQKSRRNNRGFAEKNFNIEKLRRQYIKG